MPRRLASTSASALLAAGSRSRVATTPHCSLRSTRAAPRAASSSTRPRRCETASHHAEWLARGYDGRHREQGRRRRAVTKAWRALRAACSRDGRAYGDAATVGAGLPVLATLRRLRACGDALVALEGVFSGSLSWLFNQYDGSGHSPSLLREARAFGYTEPDPRADLCGADVARKLVILARAAGHTIDIDAVEVESLVPHDIARCRCRRRFSRAPMSSMRRSKSGVDRGRSAGLSCCAISRRSMRTAARTSDSSRSARIIRPRGCRAPTICLR